MSRSRKKLGELLLKRSLISAAALVQAIEEQKSREVLLGELLLQRGLVRRDELAAAVAEVTGTPYMDCKEVQPDLKALRLIARPLAERYVCLAVERLPKALVVVMAEPQNLLALDELRFRTGLEIHARFAFRDEILTAIERCYLQHAGTGGGAGYPPFAEATEPGIEFVSSSASERNQAAVREFQADLRGDTTPAVHMFSTIVQGAVEKKASDIHIEQLDETATVRIRVDGILRELLSVPPEIRTQLISRVKILADMDITERRVPQDGRILVKVKDRCFDLRVSSLPTQYGEKLVLRLLDSAAASVSFAKLGLSDEHAETLNRELSRPQGMILVTGPTGSGKSTTLYSCLNLLRSPKVNIVTIEDPVEYVLPGVNQVQVSPKAGRTFANCLRSLMRQDPDVIMLGEIRDGETAEIALTAAQTGHLVLSTLHTNDSVSAITRLLDLGVPAFLIASSVSAILAQRLPRKLCGCRTLLPATASHRAFLESLGCPDAGPATHMPVGCPECVDGYRGRVGVFEMLTLDDAIRMAIRDGSRDDQLRELARSRGMRLLQEDALSKIKAGITSVSEVLRVVPFTQTDNEFCHDCTKPLSPGFLFCPYCGARARPMAVDSPAPRLAAVREAHEHRPFEARRYPVAATALQPLARPRR